MRFPMIRSLSLCVLALGVLSVSACDTSRAVIDPEPDFDPATVDYDTVASLDYDTYVRPLLVARNAFAPTATSEPGDDAAYAYDALLDAEWGATIIPFDGAASLLVRLAHEPLAEGVANPYPNLETLEADEVAYLRRWIEDGARGPDGAPAYADARRLLYVCNQLAGRVAIVDVDRMRTIRHVYFEDLGEPADAKPHHVVAAPDGSAWYVALIAGSDGGSVLKLSGSLTIDPGADGYLLARETPPAGSGTFEKPGMLALDTARDRLYAGRSFSASPTSNGVAQFTDLGTLAFQEVATPPVHPHAVGVSPDGRYLFTAALEPTGASTEAYVYDTDTEDLVQRLPVAGRLAFVQYAVSPDGGTVVLTEQTGGGLAVFDFEDGRLALRTSVPTGDQPWHPVFSPDGRTVYVPNRVSNTVSFVDVASGTVTRTVGNPEDGTRPLSQPHGSAITDDGRTLFVSNRNLVMSGDALYTPPVRFEGEPVDLQSNVTAIDTATGEIVAVIPQGRWASGLAFAAR